MSVICRAADGQFVLQGIEGYPCDVVLERASPGWSARPAVETEDSMRDSALTRSRAVERLLRHSMTDAGQLGAIMDDVEKALADCPE